MEDVGKALDTIVLQAVQCVPARAKGFAPAGATKGLSDRPLETFGPHTSRSACKLGNWWVHLSNVHTFFQQLEK